MISRFKTHALPLFMAFALGLTPCTSYPFVSYFASLRDLFASRISDASDEDIILLEQQDDPMASMEAARLRTTYADVAAPFVMMSFNDIISGYVSTPLSCIGCKTGFSVAYNWFAKKMKYTQIFPTFIKSILSSAVMFAIIQVVSKKLFPAAVNKNYYAHTVASRLCSRFAVACGMMVLGSQAQNIESDGA